MFRNLLLGVLMIACIFETAIAQADCLFLPGGNYVCTDHNWGTYQTKQQTPKQAVETCAAIVRKESDDKVRFKVSDFDAYVTPDETVRYFGTERERFSFEKCMNERGHPLSPVAR